MSNCESSMESKYKILSYVFVGALWGVTNPFLKKGAQQNPYKQNEEKITLKTSFMKLIKPRVYLPILINQMGSIAFYFLLATEDISITVPLCNSLTFAFTGLTGWFLGERVHQPLIFLVGVILVLLGIFICAY
jgi:uncharacterized membrane protein (UPF0136 family)